MALGVHARIRATRKITILVRKQDIDYLISELMDLGYHESINSNEEAMTSFSKSSICVNIITASTNIDVQTIKNSNTYKLFGSYIQIAEPCDLLRSYLVHVSDYAIAETAELIQFGEIDYYQLRDELINDDPYLVPALDISIKEANKQKFSTYSDLVVARLLERAQNIELSS